MRTLFRADWILPISGPPIRDGELLVDGGRILSLGCRGVLPTADAGRQNTEELGRVAILPGLANAHTHLELSWMRGAVPPAGSMPAWAKRLIDRRRAAGQDDVSAIVPAIAEIRSSGTAVVGDVGNTLASCWPLLQSRLSAVVFLELIGFNPDDGDATVARAIDRVESAARSPAVRVSIAAHAPYSTAPGLFVAIARRWGGRGLPIAVHLAESRDELRFLQDGGGAWREILEEIHAFSPTWQPPGSGPVDYLDGLGFLGPTLLAVHAVQLDVRDLRLLASRGVTVIACPRSNAWTGAGAPPVDAFYESGVRVALGTDSLASVENLSLFDELAAARRIAPRVPAGTLLRSATLDGAAALGFGVELGSIEPGKRAELIAVSLPASVGDIEEELVQGVSPDRISWIANSRTVTEPSSQA